MPGYYDADGDFVWVDDSDDTGDAWASDTAWGSSGSDTGDAWASDTGWTYDDMSDGWSDETAWGSDMTLFKQQNPDVDLNSLPADTALNLVKLFKNVGGDVFKALKKTMVVGDNQPNWAGIISAGMGLYDMFGNKKSSGYNKPVPKLDVSQEQVMYNDPNRRPGESGRKYFTDPRFYDKANAEEKTAAEEATQQQMSGLKALYDRERQPEVNPWAGKMNLAALKPAAAPETQTERAGLAEAQGLAMPVFSGDSQVMPIPIPTTTNVNLDPSLADNLVQQTANTPQQEAQAFAEGGRYLAGTTDGMSDEIMTNIDGKEPAALSHGEFVIPADVVSHLGNGNSDAGAEKLYSLMAKIREARTGNPNQGKEINADAVLEAATGGLASAYYGGGKVHKFVTGGSAPAAPPIGGAGSATGVPQDTSATNTLAPWVGDYVTNALGQGAALAAQPYQAYQGPLTAGASGLQQQAFAGASEMAQTGYTPGQFKSGLFDAAAVSQYMNPYLTNALQPQIDEARRQSEIQNLQNRTAATKAGAFGGSRGALMESEGQRNMLQNIAGITGKGYQDAYTQAMNQFNTEQNRNLDVQKANEASRQYGADFGLRSIDQLSNLGATQRGITAEGIAADKDQFEQQRDWAYKMPQYQLNLLSGLPIGATTTSVDQDALSKLMSTVSGVGANYTKMEEALKKLGITS